MANDKTKNWAIFSWLRWNSTTPLAGGQDEQRATQTESHPRSPRPSPTSERGAVCSNLFGALAGVSGWYWWSEHLTATSGFGYDSGWQSRDAEAQLGGSSSGVPSEFQSPTSQFSSTLMRNPPLAHKPSKTRSKGTCSLISLGCPKNLVDSERMLGLLRLDGYRLSLRPEGSDFVVINTCGFLQSAREESLATIREMVQLKQKGKIRGVIVTGCMAQRDQEALLEACPGIDQIVGLYGRDEIAVAAQRLMDGLTEQRTLFRPAPARALADTDRLRLTPSHLAFLKISEGCDRLCTFCSITLRGAP